MSYIKILFIFGINKRTLNTQINHFKWILLLKFAKNYFYVDKKNVF